MTNKLHIAWDGDAHQPWIYIGEETPISRTLLGPAPECAVRLYSLLIMLRDSGGAGYVDNATHVFDLIDEEGYLRLEFGTTEKQSFVCDIPEHQQLVRWLIENLDDPRATEHIRKLYVRELPNTLRGGGYENGG